MENIKENNSKLHSDLKMYFNPEVSSNFAELEQNEKSFRVAEITDKVIMSEIKDFKNPIFCAELGGGAHPDRYHRLFTRLLKNPTGHIDWIDVSPYMLELAKKYLSDGKLKDREKVISFVKSEIFKYLYSLDDNQLDLAIMKYTIDHIADLNKLFNLLSKKLKTGGRLISTIGVLSPELKSISTNARFLYNGKEFPENEKRMLKDGDTFMVKFFKESGNPNAGYLEGAETVKYYHSSEKIKELAEKYNFSIFLDDWKNLIPNKDREDEKMEQTILVLNKNT